MRRSVRLIESIDADPNRGRTAATSQRQSIARLALQKLLPASPMRSARICVLWSPQVRRRER
jgi:hypothetical protein